MSDNYLSDTPIEIFSRCPGCLPEDGKPYVVQWCDAHAPARRGIEDDKVRTEAYLQGSAEAGGDDNRRACELIHRKRLITGGPSA